jgi:ubiquinone/menaquinone biosynthesis C-methylase UbiE
MVPHPSEEDTSDLPTSVDERLRSSYTRQAARYDERRYGDWKGQFKRRAITAILEDLVPSDPSLRILDVATGTGTASIPISERGAFVVGIDLTAAMLQRARAKAREGELDRLSLAQANARNLPFAEGTFDVVTCLMLFHLLPRDIYDSFLDEMVRVLKPGGIAVIEYANPFHGAIAELYRVIVSKRRVSYLWPWQAAHLSRQTTLVGVRGSYLPLTQRIAKRNPAWGRWMLDVCRFLPFKFLASEIYVVLRKNGSESLSAVKER